ncbi:uncharacterized protein PHACADRAFT_118808 [Phanerochaete carnosa HHB-10118-sp]|uniref:Exocyst complex component Sec10-like alpha-helical bundle domain-containing protein n=1 Tax=Phanerochaete carnosa (strain HHB-10118-sp) TaxID=650164 RepID=K5V2R1_PHACS|nr:uncharacterized protein PHACADRAFT_118808 [Phanerochaete carnosa HHB-10118-sp]EKM56816.1 hypothetical protein PHACADRAFT_118808 [Phanerochaete carnosa HHB-10118-sp]
MDRFTTLEPIKLYSTPSSAAKSASKLSTSGAPANFSLIGRLPVDVHILIFSYVAVPDFPTYALSCHALARLSADERVWEKRWRAFGAERLSLSAVLDELESQSKARNAIRKGGLPPTLVVDGADDDFGDFTTANAPPDTMDDFAYGFTGVSNQSSTTVTRTTPRPTFRSRYIRAHSLLKPFVSALSSPPHTILSALFPAPAPPLSQQSLVLRLLSLFLSPRVKPLRRWETLQSSLRAAIDLFGEALLTAFDANDSNGDEKAMAEVAQASWGVWDLSEGSWELARAWMDKHEIFYEHQSKWDPLDNFTKDEQLDFDAMDAFIANAMRVLKEQGGRAVRVFPPDAGVLISFSERLANEVVGEYTTSLLTRAREISNEIFLKASAASFREAWRMVEAIVEVSSARPATAVTRTRAEDVVYRMFEPNMDEYLDEEVEYVKLCFDRICRAWERTVPTTPTAPHEQARFLSSHNPAQVKRNVLASFTDVLLLPVTIVPRTTVAVGKAFGAALTTGGNAAVQGIAMLNPQRWGGSGALGRDGYAEFGQAGTDATVFDIGDENGQEDEEKETVREKKHVRCGLAPSLSSDSNSTRISTRATTPVPSGSSFDQFEMLLSLDIALELIHTDRESLKRCETFAGYPGQYGRRVHDTVEEIFVLFLQALGERHIKPGFERAAEQMRAYQPADHEETTSVAPLLQFFELVHMGDTMQSMVQVYFDKELVPHIDKTDFLNTAVREKKHFEDILDDSVAAGLNMGTETLMNQVEHIITKHTKPREYYPPEDQPLELGPTEGCREAIKCLQMHCQLLKGSTSKEVLEVFYQEIGIRLIAILQKHIKRQIISLNGGFQVIADLNAYYAFITSLKVPSIASEFSYLKLLGHVYVVEDAKDLAQIVRDVTRYGGAYRPEDVYEFIQRRSDWKKIEKTVDKTMYNLSFKEDCIIS